MVIFVIDPSFIGNGRVGTTSGLDGTISVLEEISEPDTVIGKPFTSSYCFGFTSITLL